MKAVVAVAALGAVAAIGVAGLERRAEAQGLDLAGVGARGIARAGAIVVSVDDGAALWVNPAGLARRSRLRAQLGLFLTDRSSSFASAQAFQSDPVVEADRQGGEVGFWAGAQAAVGERVVLGAAYLEPTRLSLAAARPIYDRPDPSDDFRYPGRYGGTRLSLRRRAVALGASVRVLPSLAIGVSGLALDTHLESERTVFGGDEADPDFRNPNLDLDLALSGRDRFIPAAGGGLLFAPEALPVELAASLLWVDGASIDGTPALRDSRGATDGVARVRAIVGDDAGASAMLPGSLTGRLGVRGSLGPIGLEVAGEVTEPRGRPRDWVIRGVSVETDTASANLSGVGLAVRPRRTYTARAAVDATVASGAVTLSAGWAFTQGALAQAQLSPALPELDAHTLAIGAEGHVGRATVTLGIARTLGLARRVSEPESGVNASAPFLGTPPKAAAGTYDAAVTLIGLGLELDLD